MSKPKPFVVPEGVVFQIQDDGVVIENTGDVVLHTNFGRPLRRIVSREGSVEIHAPVSGGEVHAGKDVSLHGDATADAITAGGAVSVHGAATVSTIRAGGAVAVNGDAKGHTIEAGGAVTITGSAVLDGLTSSGNVDVQGNLQAGTVRGATIRLSGAAIQAKGVQGSQAVFLGAAKLAVDAIIAPDVHVDPKTAGRVTVVESQNELGPNAIKGGFRLADYAEMFGDPAAFLRERGLSPLGEGAPAVAPPAAPPPVVAAPVVAAPPAPPVVAAPPAPPVVAAPPEPEPEPAIAAEEEEEPSTPIGAEEADDEPEAGPAVIHIGSHASMHAAAVAAAEAVQAEPLHAEPAIEDEPTQAEPEPVEPEPVEPEPIEAEPVQAGPDDEDAGEAEATAPSSPADTQVPEIPEHPLHKQLLEAVIRIVECYGEAELPPAVARLRELIDTRSYDKVRGEITAIWSDLLKYHQKKGMRIQHQVTTTFNTINSLVKKM